MLIKLTEKFLPSVRLVVKHFLELRELVLFLHEKLLKTAFRDGLASGLHVEHNQHLLNEMKFRVKLTVYSFSLKEILKELFLKLKDFIVANHQFGRSSHW